MNQKQKCRMLKRIKNKAVIGFNNTYSLDKIIKQKIREEHFLNMALHSTERGVTEFNQNGENIIVSLTTYSKRIFEVYLVIESLLNQTKKPNKIILWLAEDEFNENTIPLILKRQQARGLEIGFCKDIKSYKKLIPALKKYPDQIIITVDDDVLYPFDMVENLYKEYLKDTHCIYGCTAHKMKFDKKNKLVSYNEWEINYQGNEKSKLIFLVGGGGILYPPNCFYEDILKEDLFMKFVPSCDDVWFKAMTLLKDYPCKKISQKEGMVMHENQDIGLHHHNIKENKNDTGMEQVFEYYPEIKLK